MQNGKNLRFLTEIAVYLGKSTSQADGYHGLLQEVRRTKSIRVDNPD